MPNVAIEQVIMIPILLLQIILFPFAANMMTTSWADSRRQVALQDAANYLGSTIQQLYLSISEGEIKAGNVTKALNLPPTIESSPYSAVGSLGPPLDPDDPDDSARVLTLSLTLQGTGNTATATITLGPDVRWIGGTFQSSSQDASIKVQKDSDGILHFSFG